ncbi:hypothetical protein AMTR_s00114p00027290 [Amborella trichopoda]|uniref:Uncharacterized protein n=1 Tax=Amborella trichopoda TaxID=13333 RepID=W1NW28_AMBTC|nr:hypothetical protein AMTR_s00114p00027290 [Amborella trichopoda]
MSQLGSRSSVALHPTYPHGTVMFVISTLIANFTLSSSGWPFLRLFFCVEAFGPSSHDNFILLVLGRPIAHAYGGSSIKWEASTDLILSHTTSSVALQCVETDDA